MPCTGSCNENQGRGYCDCTPDVDVHEPLLRKDGLTLSLIVLLCMALGGLGALIVTALGARA